MLNERQRHVLNYLVYSQSYVKTTELAKEYQTSERTIRNDLYEIESFVSNKGGEVHRNKKEGILLKAEDDTELIKEVNVASGYHNRLSPTERLKTLLGMLIQKNDVISSKQFSETLNVTRRTIFEDLKSLKKHLEKFNVDLAYIKNKGFTLDGEEYDIRRSYKGVSNDSEDNIGLTWLLQNSYLDEKTNVALKNRISEILQQFSIQLTDVAFEGLLVHVSIALQRLNQGNTIKMTKEKCQELKTYSEFETALEIRKAMNNISGRTIPEDEAAYITLHLLGAKSFYEQPEKEDQQLKEITNKLIAKVSFQCGVDFIDDEYLLRGLLTHLQPSIYRLKYDLDLANPMKSYIKKEYQKLVDVILNNVYVLENEFSVTFNEDEICYLALHFRAAIERKEVNRDKIKAVLVCGSGVGTVELLKSRLNRFFPSIEVLACLPYHELDKGIAHFDIDYIISTVPIDYYDIPTIQVNPFINKEDRDKISSSLNAQRETLLEERKSGPVLEDILTPELIDLEAEVDSWESAVRRGGELLVQHEKVEPRYVEAMISMVQEHGPYVVLDKGVAMPHARPNQGVKSLCLSLIRLKNPVKFGHDTNDPVHLVICLGSIDSETHLNALRQLIMILSDDSYKEILLNGDEESVMNIIREGSKK